MLPYALRLLVPGLRHQYEQRARRTLLAGAAGNLIEWYDLGAYGYLTTVTAAHFCGGDAWRERH